VDGAADAEAEVADRRRPDRRHLERLVRIVHLIEQLFEDEQQRLLKEFGVHNSGGAGSFFCTIASAMWSGVSRVSASQATLAACTADSAQKTASPDHSRMNSRDERLQELYM